MVELQTLFSMVDELPPDDLESLYQHIKQRRLVVSLHTATGTFQTVPEATHQETAEAIREEVNAIIDDAIAVVRRKRETQETARTGR
jgi:5-methylcytosine-specific restriction endonuclease McrBC regulatory subunit McrC